MALKLLYSWIYFYHCPTDLFVAAYISVGGIYNLWCQENNFVVQSLL